MKSVLITGTSSGIGRACALRLSTAGMRVLAGVRDPADGERLAAVAQGIVEPVVFDVTDAEAIAAAAERAKELTDGDGLVGLINNAGQPVTGPLEVLPIDDLRRQLEVNLIGQLAVTQAFLPQLRAARGRVIFISSVGGRIVLPFAGAYHASKWGLEAVAEALRQELHGSGVEVSAIEPGVTGSEIWKKGFEQSRALLESLPAPQRNLYSEDLEKFKSRLDDVSGRDGNMDADAVAEVVEKALTTRRPAARYPVGLAARVITRVRPLIPDRLYDRLARRALGL